MKKWRISLNSPVILAFLFICFAVTLAGTLTDGLSTQIFFMTYHSPLSNPLTWLRFVTHVFGHSGWTHFFGNATYVLLLGPMLEEKYGSGRLTAVMLFTAAATGVLNYILFPNVALCGASGIAFAMILLSSFTDFQEGEIPITFLLVAAVFLGQQVYEAVAVQDNISNMAHIVGGLIGAAAGYSINRKKGPAEEIF